MTQYVLLDASDFLLVQYHKIRSADFSRTAVLSNAMSPEGLSAEGVISDQPAGRKTWIRIHKLLHFGAGLPHSPHSHQIQILPRIITDLR
jgi:hypothetical protein